MSRFYRLTMKTLTHTIMLLFVCAALLTGCAKDPGVPLNQEVAIPGSTFSFDRDSYPTDQGLFPEYHIAPGDVLDVLFQIRTWKQNDNFALAIDHTISVKFVHTPELNETQRIQPDGKVSLPYLGEVYVVNKTVQELTDELKDRYRNILRDPEIYVTVPEFRSRIKELKNDLHTAPRGLSRLVMVRPDGYATFPLIGDLFVGGKVFKEMNETLDRLYDKVLPGLHVDLFLEKHSGSVFYVFGEVMKSGAYQIAKPIGVLEGIALAGGTRYSARLDSIFIFRKKQNKLVATRYNAAGLLAPGEKSTYFYIRPDDIIYIPKTRIANLAELNRDIADILFFRGWSISVEGIDIDNN